MTKLFWSSVRFLIPVLVAAFGSRLPAAEKPEQIEFFEKRIRPVLAQDCYECHSSKGEADGGLVLDHRKGLLKGGDRGPAIVPGKPDQSLLIQAIRHDDEDLEMPSAAPKLDAAIIRDFEQWVRMGAPDPRDQPPTEAELAADTDWSAVMERRKSWWSFQPIGDPAPPAINAVNHPVDRFIRHRLAEARLQPAEPAEPQILVRRLTFALTGLPPTQEQLRQFTQQHDRTAAINQLVAELLESPHFGERWARHWMDWIRYAESHGSEGDPRIEKQIWEAHKQYTLEFIHFLTTDPIVPEGIRNKYAKLGLCKDEFGSYGHFSPALYVRESRRMKGMYVISQKDILEEPKKHDPIAISSFLNHSHDVQRVALKVGGVINEGTIFPVRRLPGQGYAYHVPYRSILPHARAGRAVMHARGHLVVED